MTKGEDILHDMAALARRVITEDRRLGNVNAGAATDTICERIRILWGGQPVYLSANPAKETTAGDHFLGDVTDAAADTFRQAGVHEANATQAAAELAGQFRHLLSSQPVYIRKQDADYYTERDQAIRREFDGTWATKRALCLKYGIGYHRLQQILKNT